MISPSASKSRDDGLPSRRASWTRWVTNGKTKTVLQGEVYWLDTGEPWGSEPGYRRPWLIVQNDALNDSRIATTVVVAISSNLRRAAEPGHVLMPRTLSGLPRDSVAVCSQIVTIDKRTLDNPVGVLPHNLLMRVASEVQAIVEPAPVDR
jgi:mRNA interferase MazF